MQDSRIIFVLQELENSLFLGLATEEIFCGIGRYSFSLALLNG
jgi:hypothetical protein